MFDLEPDHTSEHPRVRRLNMPYRQHPTYWEFTSDSPITDVAEDLLGPDVKVHHSKLNFKWSDGGEEVKWHQDIPFYPHTNYGVLAIGVYLEDVDDEMGPMGIVRGSHKRRSSTTTTTTTNGSVRSTKNTTTGLRSIRSIG